jgi:4-amino-4-deoxy-L-arabinose transferase-like glycosyltransferase
MGDRNPTLRTTDRPPLTVWIVTSAFGLLLVVWSFLAPMARAPDEHNHVDLSFHVADGEPYPEFDGRRTSTAMLNVLQANAGGFLTQSGAGGEGERRTFTEWGGAEPSARINQLAQHPPLYYWMTGAALRAERLVTSWESAPLDVEWHLLRLINAAIVVPLPLLCWCALRRLGATQVAATTAAVVPLAVPQLLHIGSTANNDNLLALLGACVAALLAGVLRGDDRRRVALALGAVTGLALLTKAFAIAFLPWIALAYGYQGLRYGLRQAATGLAISWSTAALLAAWWPVENLVQHGELFPAHLSPIHEGALRPSDFSPDLLWFAGHFATSMTHRFWGNFGYYDAPMSPVVVGIASAVVGVAAVAAFLPPRRRMQASAVREPSRVSLVLFASVLVPVLVLVAGRAYDLYQRSGFTPFMHGRYLFCVLVPFAAVVAVGLARLLGAWAPFGALAAAVAMQAHALHVALRDLVIHPDGASVYTTFAASVETSPLPAALANAAFIGGWACAVTAMLYSARSAASAADSTQRSTLPPAGRNPTPPVRPS